MDADCSAIKLTTELSNTPPDSVPIYNILTRIKSPESICFKIPRKNTTCSNINDFVGLKVLCLFEDEIISIHKHITKTIKSKKISNV